MNNPRGPSVTIRPFEEEAGDNAANRERDIRAILFEVSEVFAPFNVEVRRAYGGSYGKGAGDTTVFVGANAANSTTSNAGGHFSFTKYSYSVTFPASNDYPRPGHAINSDSFDVAFVDTVLGSTTVASQVYSSQYTRRAPTDSTRVDIAGIADGVAHEAGHTFGLSHVRTDGKTDPATLSPGTVKDLLSYNSPNQYFAYQAINLTSANNNGTSVKFTGVYPSYLANVPINGDPVHTVPTVVPLKTQNAYLTLEEVLGMRPTDQYANVANRSAVYSIYYIRGGYGYGPGAAPKPDLDQYGSLSGTLGRPGDFQVLTATSSSNFSTIYSVRPSTTRAGFSPDIMLYDATGTTLVSFSEPSATSPSSVTIPRGSGSFQVVIGSVDGSTTGAYTVTHSFSFAGVIATQSETVGAPASASPIAPLIVSVPTSGAVATPEADRATPQAKPKSPAT